MTRPPVSLWQVGFLVNGGFQLWRGAVVDACIFTVAALLMALPPRRGGHPRRGLPAVPRRAFAPLIACATVYFALAPLQQQPNRVVLAAVGPFALWRAWTPTVLTLSAPDDAVDRAAAGGTAAGIRRSHVLWGTWFIALCCWEGVAYVLSRAAGSELANPTVTVLVEPSLQSDLGRGAFTLSWVVFGLTWIFGGRAGER